MTSEVVLLISILCLIKCTWCGNYGFALGQRHSNDEVLYEELLTNNNDSDETVIEYVYTADKPITYMQLRTDTNIYTEVTFVNSTKIYMKLSNFENMDFNATLTIYGFPFYPDGPEPDDDNDFLLQPDLRKAIYLNKSSVEESGIIATNGAYMSEEINTTEEDSNAADEYYDYDYTSVLEEDDTDEDEQPESIIDVNPNVEVVGRAVVVSEKISILIILSFVLIIMVL